MKPEVSHVINTDRCIRCQIGKSTSFVRAKGWACTEGAVTNLLCMRHLKEMYRLADRSHAKQRAQREKGDVFYYLESDLYNEDFSWIKNAIQALEEKTHSVLD